jgi:hypothetical protein
MMPLVGRSIDQSINRRIDERFAVFDCVLRSVWWLVPHGAESRRCSQVKKWLVVAAVCLCHVRINQYQKYTFWPAGAGESVP